MEGTLAPLVVEIENTDRDRATRKHLQISTGGRNRHIWSATKAIKTKYRLLYLRVYSNANTVTMASLDNDEKLCTAA
jgi:hypothetical protein